MKNFPKKWKCRRAKEIDYKLTSKLNCSPILIRLLANRGITTQEEILSFLKPSLKNLHDPKLLPGIEEGIKRIRKAIYNRENVLIFGDYDTDGIISSVLMYSFLKELGLNVDIYIPDRFDEGYDINVSFLKRVLKNKTYSLIICVDCGTNSTEVQEYIYQNKIDIEVIACDHHQPSTIFTPKEIDNMKKYIIINPKLKDSIYPFKDLSGGGVTFKFVTAILRELEEKFKKRFNKNYLTSLLDIVAISTIADMMPVLDENRVIVKRGLDILRNTSNKGLRKMLDKVLKDVEEITPHHVGFIIAPRLNAAGRIQNAEHSIKLLKGDEKDLDQIVNELNLLNEKRQAIQESVFKEIVDQNDFSRIVPNQKIFIAKSEKWSEGILGIVASDLVKKFNIPVILFKEKGEKLKGSGRSIENFNLYESLLSMKSLFEKFGGHQLACGITMHKSNFEYFKNEMIKIANARLSDQDIEQSFYYDLEISFKDMNSMFIKELQLLKPFGVGNPKPVFATRNCKILHKNYSQDEKHLKIKLKNNNVVFSGVMFEVSEDAKAKICNDEEVNILYTIEETRYQHENQNMTQLVIMDLC